MVFFVWFRVASCGHWCDLTAHESDNKHSIDKYGGESTVYRRWERYLLSATAGAQLTELDIWVMLVVRDVELVLVEFLPKDGAAPFARTQTQAGPQKDRTGQDQMH